VPNKLEEFLETYFYFCMSLLIAVVVVYGFTHTVEKNFIHPAIPRPRILYFHVAVFSTWVIFFLFQSALVRTRNISLHRTLGWFGAALGTAIPVLGISTAITMAQFRISNFHATHTEADLIVQFFDMASFTIPFALAILWRKKLEFHRRLILIATCALTSAAFGRFPIPVLRDYFYIGVDLLILLGVTRDLIVDRRVHKVYLYSLPILAFSQIIVLTASIYRSK
jgi:hypothetical protein